MCLNREKINLNEDIPEACNLTDTSLKTTDVTNSNCTTKTTKKKMSPFAHQSPENKFPELTMKSFFDFMSTAYGVHNSFEELVDTVTANSEIDWNALAKTDLNAYNLPSNESLDTEVQNKSNDAEKNCIKHMKSQLKTNASNEEDLIPPEPQHSCQNKEPNLSRAMKKHLSDILHEGMLDSVLQYMIPTTTLSDTAIQKPSPVIESRRSSSLSDNRESSKIVKEKPNEKDNFSTRRKSFESEIEIHVCDEAKNIKKDFRCPQKLLIQNMCYFADVTAGQKLEEMDISVHCDIVIFDWLMRWVKRDIIKKSEWPVLEPTNVIPIMISASFLQMEPLINSCLIFCHDRMSDILKTSSVLSCLNDNLLTRLVELFTNIEVEYLKDKKDKIQSKLFCKLILLLGKTDPDNSKGHYSSLSRLFKCGKCEKNIIHSLSDSIPCIPSSIKIDSRGILHNKHSRHLKWDLNDYIISLRSNLRSWRKVYWRLWGDCHYMFCSQCDTYFPINQMNWCAYHPEDAQYFINEHKKFFYPIGRYPCCSQKTFRFEVLPNRNGCKFKDHLPKVNTKQEAEILEIFSTLRAVIAIDPPDLYFPEKITRLVSRDETTETAKLLGKETNWWEGIELAPPRLKLGLLSKIWGSKFRKACPTPTKSQKKNRHETKTTDGSSAISSISDSDDECAASDFDTSFEDNSYYSDESRQCLSLNYIRSRGRDRYSDTKRNASTNTWSSELTIRCNQDNQREFEEKMTKQMISLLTKRSNVEVELALKTKPNNKIQCNNVKPLGGTYVKLENEFREKFMQNYKGKHTTQNSIRSTRSAK